MSIHNSLIEEALRNDGKTIMDTLEVMKVPFLEWGTLPMTRPITDFVEEYQRGAFDWDLEANEIVLNMSVVIVNVIYHTGTSTLVLREKNRDFGTDKIHDRVSFGGTFAERLVHNDTCYSAAIRGIGKKLGEHTLPQVVDEPAPPSFKDPHSFKITQDKVSRRVLEPRDYAAYPPFKMVYHQVAFFRCLIPAELYAPTYTYHKKTNVTHFDWVDASSPQ